MNLSISNSCEQLHSYLTVTSDKPSVRGILFNMKPTPRTAPCNQCGLQPKYPSQGLCKECFFKKQQLQWIEKRKSRNNSVKNLRGEKWIDIVGADGYQVSSMGRVKSKNYRCRIQQENGKNEKLIKLREARKGGYLKVDLDKYNMRPSIHRLVAIYFVPNPYGHPIVLHKDENKQNNKASNLEWGTKSKNGKDYSKYAQSAGIPRQKLSKENVLIIFRSKESVQSLSIRFKVSATTIWGIKTGHRWYSVTGLKKARKIGRGN